MIGDKIRGIRKELNLTQVEFAKKLGISRSYLGDLERGRLKGTNVNMLSKLSEVTNKPIEYFLDKPASIKLYDTLDYTINMLIEKNLIDNDGKILDPNAQDMLLNILKEEIKLKLKNR
ncbi:MAG: helix-turn-helix transcriptional regulator [Clostridium sp.]|nr:helix-turn-helix transcriptional regulator [Clostridium sp.]